MKYLRGTLFHLNSYYIRKIMENKIFIFGVFVFALLHVNNFSVCQSFPSNEEFPEIILERTEVRALHSEYVGQDFELFISLPRSYTSSDATYPVIYILDSYLHFTQVKGLTDVLSWLNPMIPEVILVGIGYGGSGQEAALNWLVGRTRDLSPVKNKLREESYQNRLTRNGILHIEIETGGAPQFLDFLSKELFPLMESNYRIDKNLRMLSGYSAGGLFGLYALFHDPDLFSKYFIGSPSITSFQDSITFTYELDYANSHADLSADVFMSVGQLEEENSESMKKIANLIYSRNYENLNLKTMVFENENHYTCYSVAITRGLVELLGRTGDE